MSLAASRLESNNQSSQYAISAVCAAGSLMPIFPFLVRKTAAQLEIKPPKIGLLATVKGGASAGSMLGLQTALQMKVDQTSRDVFQTTGVIPRLASSLVVGSLSAPFLAILNGKTMGNSLAKSLRNLSVKQIGVIALRETAFLGALLNSGPICDAMQERFGKSLFVETAGSFGTGMVGSLLGHPADTALTRWQRGMKVEHFSQLAKGSIYRSFAIGVFSSLFQFSKKIVSSSSAKHEL